MPSQCSYARSGIMIYLLLHLISVHGSDEGFGDGVPQRDSGASRRQLFMKAFSALLSYCGKWKTRTISHLLLHLISVHESDEGVVGRVAQHAPGVPPGQSLLCVKHCAPRPRQVLLKVGLGIHAIPAFGREVSVLPSPATKRMSRECITLHLCVCFKRSDCTKCSSGAGNYLMAGANPHTHWKPCSPELLGKAP